MTRPLTNLTCLWLACTLGACALFGKSAPFEPRYFSPEGLGEGESGAPRALAQRSDRALSLRLERVVASAHLRERIAYQSAPRELGFYEARRWTERPEAYVRRALARALFEQRGIGHAVSGPAPTLELELTEFTELLAPEHGVRVRMRALLSDGQSALLEQTFSVEQKVAADAADFTPVANAMASALERCVSELADRVVQTLRAVASASLAAATSADAGSAPP